MTHSPGKPTGDDGSLTLPSVLLAAVQAEADRAHRSAAEVVRDALERYLAQPRTESAEPPASRTAAEAAARMRERRKGSFLPAGVSIRDLMTHGRA